jgi:transketolase
MADLRLNPKKIRQNILQLAKNGDSVHIACSFSLVEICSLLYSKYLHLTPENINSPQRNLLCLSKGHGVMAVYSCLYELGILEQTYIDNYFKDGSLLKGLSDAHVPGIEVSGGSLGHGVTVSVGLAFAIQRKKENRTVYCIVGDGEINEGSVWESILFAAHWRLDNFILIIDANEYQAMGLSSEILNLEPMLDKFKAFNFETYECNGHSMEELDSIFNKILNSKEKKPKVVIARTIKGYGISFMERDNRWHYTRLNDETFAKAQSELI